MDILQIIIEEAIKMHWLEWVATFTALIYVILAARENIWCWFWGIISCSLWAYASFVFYALYFDALLQIFYVIMGFIGIYQWKFGGKEKKERPITSLKKENHLFIIIGGSLLALLFGYLFDEYTLAAATYLDAFTTVFAIIATLILVQKIIDNWLYWIIIDALYIYLYGIRGAYLFALLMIIYVIIAISAYFQWEKSLKGIKKP